MTEVTQAIAAFERTQVAGDSPFDRYYFGGEEDALTEQQKRGFDLFVNQGRCVSCHVIEQTRRCSPTTASTTSAWASTTSRTTSPSWPASS